MQDDVPLSPVDQLLNQSTDRLEESRARAVAPIGTAATSGPAALDSGLVRSFERAADQYGVPVDALLAIAEKDSNFNPLARSRGPGAKTRGIISMSDEDMQRSGANPYVTEQAVGAAAAKIKGYLDSGMTLDDAIRAHVAGPNRDAWGPQADEYLDDVRARAGQIAERLYPVQPEPEPQPAAKEKVEGSLAGDAARQFGGGAVKGAGYILQGLGKAKETLEDFTVTPVLDAIFGPTPERKDPMSRAGDAIVGAGKRIQEGVSDDTRQAIENSSPKGSLIQPSTWTLGKNPSLRGYTALGLDLFGGMLPVIAGTVVSGGSMAAGAVIGGAQGGGGAVDQVREAINKLAETPADPDKPDGPKQIEKESAYYRQLIAEGKTPSQALNLTRSAAERYAFLFTTPVSALGGALTSKILHPAGNVLAGRGVAGRVAGKGALGAAEEGIQETGEQIAQNVGQNVGAGTDVDPMDDTFGQFILGAIGGGVTGGGSGLLRPRASHGQSSPSEVDAFLEQARSASVPADAVAAPADQSPAQPTNDSAPGVSPSVQAVEAGGGDTAKPSPAASQPVAPPPPRPTSAGPLGRALDAGAPQMREAAKPAGGEVVVTDEVGQRAGHIVSQDAEGITFRDADGVVEVISPEDIASGAVKVTTLSDAPQMPVARAEEASAPERTPTDVDGMQPFAPETGTLGVPREEMPQVKSEHHGALVNHLNAKGIAHETTEVDPSTLKPTQDKFSPEKVARAKDEGNGDRSVIVSSDGHVIDGHHQVMAAQEKGEPVKAIVLDAPVEKALQAVKDSPSAEVPVEKRSQVERPARVQDRPLTEMSEPELRQRLKYLADQAKGNGGWSKMLVERRREVEAAITARQVQERKGAKGSNPSSTGLAEAGSEMGSGIVDTMYEHLWKKVEAGDITELGKPSALLQVAARARANGGVQTMEQFKALAADYAKVERGPTFQADMRKVIADHSPTSAAPISERKPTAKSTHERGSDGRLVETFSPENHVGSILTAITSGGSVHNSTNLAFLKENGLATGNAKAWESGYGLKLTEAGQKVADAWKGYGQVPGDALVEMAAKFKRDDGGSTPPTGKTNSPESAAAPQKATTENPYAGKWFGSRDKAQAFIDKKKIGETHEVSQTGKVRFEIARKGSDAPVTALAKDGSEVTITPPKAEHVEAAKNATEHPRRQIGVNRNGDPLFEDENGVRSFVKDGVRQTESVLVQGGKPRPRNQAARSNDFELPIVHPEVAKAEAPKAEPAAERSDYGAKNKFVSADRAAELRERLKKKLRDAGAQLNSGIDPEMLAIGTELAAFHIEAGARAFADFASAISADLGASVGTLKPYLRAWYNGARDLMEDQGHSISGMDNPEVVRTELARITKESVADEPAKLDQPGERPLAAVHTEAVSSAESGRATAGSPEGRVGTDKSGDERPASGGLRRASGVGNDAREVPVPAGREADEGGARSERGGEDVQRDRESQEQAPASAQRGLKEPSAGRPAPEAGSDFAITDADRIGEGGTKTKFRGNIEAIETLRRLEASGEQATRADQAALAKFVGWGGLRQAFERSDGAAAKGWEKEVSRLREVLTPEELAAAAASTRNAHYTSPEIVQGMWTAMRRLGFTGGRVLEPSVGVGNFFGLMPANIRSASALHGVELDPITGGIAKHLYPAAKIAAPMGFQSYAIPDGFFDAVVGNPPFGSEKLYDPLRKDLSGFSIHNYFFAKALDGLRPGGIMAMVVTNRMLDAQSDAARQYFVDRADLLAAIRLPNDAFLKNAGTAVTTDIVFLRKRADGEKQAGAAWTKLVQHEDKNGATVPLNEYFAAHPENMLGDFGAFGSMYREGDPSLVARPGQDTAKLLADAIKRLPENVFQPVRAAIRPEPIAVKADVSSVRVGSMFMEDGKVMVREPDSLGETRATAVDFPSEKAQERVSGMIGVRDAFADLRRLQLDSKATDAKIDESRKALNAAYDSFVAKSGFINSEANKRLFRDDPSWPQISALEDNYDKGVTPAVSKTTGQPVRKPSASKAAIFSRRTQSPYSPPTSAASAKDALVSSLSEHGRVDLPFMEKLYGKSVDAIVKELGDLVYDDPVRGVVTADAYLSGNVKKKLAEAKEKASQDRAYDRNVRALEAVQPADVQAIDIDVKPGAHWIPQGDMIAFAGHVAGTRQIDVFYNPVNAKWTVRADRVAADASTRWGTARVRVVDVIEAAANQQQITIRDKQADGSSVVNEVETQAANDKVAAVTEEWRRWIFSEDERRDRLSRLYNDQFNTNVQRSFDGSHLSFPGKVDDAVIALRPHQANAVWRVLQSDTTLLDHVVGAGKTFTVVAAAMEGRRMGLMRKPMLVVPNHLVGQWAADFSRLYPGANVLATTKRDFEAGNRKKLFARIATGDWDAVIVAHSSFGKVEVDPQRQAAYIEDQVKDLVVTQEAMRQAEGKKSRNVSQVEQQIAKLKEKQKKLLDAGRKDDSLYWHELGADALFVDEAHEFKNLAYSTSMQRVAGLGSREGSQKASDMHLKVQQVLDTTGGRNITFATGTPISNTMAEMFTMQRYLDGKALAEQGLAHFDAWARMYGEVVNDWELTPAGKYKLNSRFAKFVNMPELMQRYTSFADVINRDDIKAQLAARGQTLPIPTVKGGRPENIVVERSPQQARYIGEPIKNSSGFEMYPSGSLIWRSDNIPKRATKGADNMLKIMSDARKAALDMRLIDPSAPDFAGSKVNVAAERIKRLYDRWHDDKGTQLVFIDLSTPKAAAAKEAAALRDLMARADEGDEAARDKLDAMSPDEFAALDSAFSVYDDLKQKLIARGIPEGEIAFIHDANTGLQKDDLFAKVRSGRVRVLFGSTAKMGAGMNVQDRLVGLHHLDAPWRPSDLEQREGRIIRQGNKLYERDPSGFEVAINRYATKQTLDARMWQTIEAKANFIEQLRKGVTGQRTAEDVGGEAMNAAEMKAAASGNPRVLEEMQLRKERKRLENEERAFTQDQFRTRDSIRMNQRWIAEDAGRLEAMQKDLGRETPKEFAMTVVGETFDKRKDAGERIVATAAEMEKTGARRTAIGSYGDFRLTLERSEHGNTFEVAIKGDGEYRTTTFTSAADPQGVAQRIVNTVNDTRNIAEMKAGIEQKRALVERLKRQVGEWPKAAELETVRDRHSAVVKELRAQNAPKPGSPEAKASVGQEGVGSMSSTELADSMTRGENGTIIGKMIDAGRIIIHDDASTLPAASRPEGAILGMTMPDGTIHLVAGNLSPETARGVLLHEVFHSGAEALVGSAAWNALMDRVQRATSAAMERAVIGEPHASGDFWSAALARAQAAEVPTAHLAEEVAAYAIENRESAPAGLREMVDGLVGRVKAWALRTFGRQFGDVTPGQLKALATAALRSWNGDKNVSTDRGTRFSVAPNENGATSKGKGLFDRAKKQVSDMVTSMMVGTKGSTDSVGKFGALAFVPTRPLFMELTRGMAAARDYLSTKQAMDAMRNEWFQVAHETIDRWRAYAGKNKAENRELMDLMHESTLAQADPSKPFESSLTAADRSALKNAKAGSEAHESAMNAKLTDDARQKAWDDLKPRFDALSDEGKALYGEVRDAYQRMADAGEAQVMANIQKALDQMVRRAERDHADEISRIADEGLTGKEKDEAVAAADLRLLTAKTRQRRARAARIKSMRAEFESNRLKGPYFPLSRFGNYFVTVRGSDGKVVSFSRFEKRGKQREFAEEMRKDGYAVEEGIAEAKGSLERNIDPKFVAEIDTLLENARAPDSVRDALWQRYLETLPDFSVRKSRIHRKGRAGFNTDAMRAFAHNMFHGSHQLARLTFGQDLQEYIDEARRQARDAVDPVRAQAVVNEMVLRHDFIMNPKAAPWSHALSSFAFVWTMGANISSAIVNLDQAVTKGIPYLAYDEQTHAGLAKATAETLRAMRDFTTGKGAAEASANLSADEKAAMRVGYESGLIDRTQAHDVAGVAETGVEYKPWRNKIMRLLSFPMHQTERFNREVTFLAGYRLARDAGLSHAEGIKKASDLTWMTHFDNQSTSKARFMQGDIGRVAFALKGFQANLLYRLFRDLHQTTQGETPEARKAAFGRVAASIALTGAAAGIKGTAFYSLVMMIAGAVMGAAGSEDDPDEALRKWILDHAGDSVVGRAVGGMMMDGVPGYLTGTALSGRLGMSDLWFRSNDRDMNSEQTWNYWLEQMGGAPLSLGHQVYQGASEIGKGNVVRGVEKMLPAALKNVAKAGRYAVEGVKDKTGDTIVEKVPLQDVVKQAVGFTPAEIADRFARNTFQSNLQRRIKEDRSSAMKAAGRARVEGDEAAFEKATKKVDEFNERHPEYGIRAKNVRQSAKAIQGRTDRKEFGVDLQRSIAPFIKEKTSPSIYSRD